VPAAAEAIPTGVQCSSDRYGYSIHPLRFRLPSLTTAVDTDEEASLPLKETAVEHCGSAAARKSTSPVALQRDPLLALLLTESGPFGG
jgi:hypothetical protein